jgi:hypothetical protein
VKESIGSTYYISPIKTARRRLMQWTTTIAGFSSIHEPLVTLYNTNVLRNSRLSALVSFYRRTWVTTVTAAALWTVKKKINIIRQS